MRRSQLAYQGLEVIVAANHMPWHGRATWCIVSGMIDTISRWRLNGVRVVRADELDANTAQTPGMHRRAAVTTALTGATKLWAGTVTIDAKARTGAHHHGDLESVIYVVNGFARLRW